MQEDRGTLHEKLVILIVGALLVYMFIKIVFL